MNGFYSACTINYPYADDPRPRRCATWFATYKGKYSEDPTVLSAYGYQLTDLFIEAAKKAGKDLNPDTLAKSLASLTVPADFFGGDEQKFSATQAPRLRPRDAVPDPGRQVEVGVGVFDELS